MALADDRHPTDDRLECYAMGRLAGQELEELEEHLLACTRCQDRLALEDAFTQGIRSAASAAVRPPAASRWPLARPVWALGLAVLGLLIFLAIARQAARRPAAAPAVVVLQTTRGADNPPVASVPAGKPITLALDLTDLPRASEYRVEVVDATGHPVFQSKAAPEKDNLRTTVSGGLARGAYFVRIYSAAQELLREYALIVRP